ncbi:MULTISPECIES: hypothetical protein [unclassified Lysinibacillus]|uniref:hypothetical protein n=1 Tax=unclassified Lysinibacillus TaxID=2636778 RepID=UPI0025549F13|nr:MULTISPECIES: hypothetical protein [unclassified Lysinibacillus]MDM5248411.1 hypothetical protein [Lysinibacillus sp. G4S2]
MQDIRPTSRWRNAKREEEEEFTAGLIEKDDCIYAELFPDSFIHQTEMVLEQYAASIAKLPNQPDSYPAIMKSIETAVLALNEINEVGGGGLIETGEREELCDYFDQVLIQRGIDIDDLTKSQNLGRYELTDDWREW